MVRDLKGRRPLPAEVAVDLAHTAAPPACVPRADRRGYDNIYVCVFMYLHV